MQGPEVQFLAHFAQFFPLVVCKACFPPAQATGTLCCGGCTLKRTEFKFRGVVLPLIGFLIKNLKSCRMVPSLNLEAAGKGTGPCPCPHCTGRDAKKGDRAAIKQGPKLRLPGI